MPMYVNFVMYYMFERYIYMTLEEAIKRIEELERDNKKFKSELEYYKNRKTGGRKKHDEAWMNSFNDFATKYGNGMTIMEIVDEGRISRRTAYRYKAYYDELNIKDA